MIGPMEKKPQQSESRDADKYVVRFPDGMRDRIAEEAKANNRSMNAEIIARLEQSLGPISDEASAMRAIKSLMEYGKKYEFLVSINITDEPEKILAKAIKNGSLPPDATLDDLDNPGAAIERMERERVAKGSSESADPSPAKRNPRKPKA